MKKNTDIYFSAGHPVVAVIRNLLKICLKSYTVKCAKVIASISFSHLIFIKYSKSF